MNIERETTMKDPGNPRERAGTTATSNSEPPALDRIVEMVTLVVRAATMIGLLILLMIGAYYLLHVFSRVGAFIAHPEEFSATIDTFAEMIDADGISFTVQEDDVQPGRIVAMFFLLMWYGLWAWLPLQIITHCSKILLAGIRKRPSEGQSE